MEIDADQGEARVPGRRRGRRKVVWPVAPTPSRARLAAWALAISSCGAGCNEALFGPGAMHVLCCAVLSVVVLLPT